MKKQQELPNKEELVFRLVTRAFIQGRPPLSKEEIVRCVWEIQKTYNEKGRLIPASQALSRVLGVFVYRSAA